MNDQERTTVQALKDIQSENSRFFLYIYNDYSWKKAYGRLPRYQREFDDIEDAKLEAVCLANELKRIGDGRCDIIICENDPKNVVMVVH